MSQDLSQLEVALTFFANSLKTVTNVNTTLSKASMNIITPASALGNMSKYYISGSFDDSDIDLALSNIEPNVTLPEGYTKFLHQGSQRAPFGGSLIIMAFDNDTDSDTSAIKLKLSSVTGQTSEGPSQLSIMEVQ